MTGDEKILASAVCHADFLIDELDEYSVDIADTGTFYGLPGCSILKPMLILYKYTEKKKYFDFAVSVAENRNKEDGKCPNLLKNSLSEKRLTEWYPESVHWTKAYETMSCFEGIIELY